MDEKTPAEPGAAAESAAGDPPPLDAARLFELRLQRAIDDELEPPELRQLVAACDAEPACWRSLALAFLEEQAIAGACRREAREGAAPTGAPGPRGSSRSAGSRGALAAALVLAAAAAGFGFGLGRSWDLPGGGEPPHEVGAAPAAAAALVLQVGPSGGGPAEGLSIPLFEADGLADAVPGAGSKAFPAAVRQDLVRQGFRVEERREILPVRLEDGRRVVVPLESYQLEYRGTTLFQ
jgi:hypothetical protein